MTVERLPVYKFLGVTINSALKRDDHVTAVTSKAAKHLLFLKKNFKNLPASMLKTLYITAKLSSGQSLNTRVV